MGVVIPILGAYVGTTIRFSDMEFCMSMDGSTVSSLTEHVGKTEK